MTTKQHRDQDDHRRRAVWLARVSSGRSQAEEGHRDRWFKANELAREHSAELIGEFLISSGEDKCFSDDVWDEVLEFVRHLDADLLVVLTPSEIAHGFSDYCRRAEMLEAAGIELAVWAVDAMQGESEEPTAA